MMREFSGTIRWGSIVLFFSLALNFFVAGYLVSDNGIFSNRPDSKIIRKRPEIRIVDYFPRKERQKFHRLMGEQRQKLLPVERRIFASQKEFFKVISAQQVDEGKLRQVIGKYQNSSSQLQTVVNEMVIKIVLEMNYDTRRAIIARGKRAHERREIFRKRWRGGPPDRDG